MLNEAYTGCYGRDAYLLGQFQHTAKSNMFPICSFEISENLGLRCALSDCQTTEIINLHDLESIAKSVQLVLKNCKQFLEGRATSWLICGKTLVVDLQYFEHMSLG